MRPTQQATRQAARPFHLQEFIEYPPDVQVLQGCAMTAFPPSMAPGVAGNPNPIQPVVVASMAAVNRTGVTLVSRFQYSLALLPDSNVWHRE